MNAHWLTDLRNESRHLGIPWPAIREAYAQIREEEILQREHPNAIRQAAWAMATSPGCHPFWRHGFLSRWGQRIARGADYTIIPRHDEIAQQIGWDFPEVDDSQQLWDFLLSPHDRLPTAKTMYSKALDRAERELSKPVPDDIVDATF